MLEEIGYEHIDSVVVTAYASPEGVYEHNQMLCRKRAREFDKVVKKELGLAAAGLDAMPTFWQIGGMVAAISCVLIFSRE